jgi:hypothetical protein
MGTGNTAALRDSDCAQGAMSFRGSEISCLADGIISSPKCGGVA